MTSLKRSYVAGDLVSIEGFIVAYKRAESAFKTDDEVSDVQSYFDKHVSIFMCPGDIALVLDTMYIVTNSVYDRELGFDNSTLMVKVACSNKVGWIIANHKSGAEWLRTIKRYKTRTL